MSSSTSNSSCSVPSSSKTSSKRRRERGRWYSTVSALTSRKLSLRNSHTFPMSRFIMWRTLIRGPAERFLPLVFPPSGRVVRRFAIGASLLRADARDQLLDLLDELRPMMALELGPCRERARIGAVDEDLAEQVVDLVLVGAGLEAMHDLVDRVAVAVPCLAADVNVALHLAAQVRHAETALVVVEQLIVDGREHRVDEDGQRDLRLVRIARVVADLDRADLDRLVDLDRGEPGAVGVVHRLDEVVDARLHRGGRELFTRHLARDLTKDGVADLGDLADCHGAATLAHRGGGGGGGCFGICADNFGDRGKPLSADAAGQLALDPAGPQRATVDEAGVRLDERRA